MLCYRPLHFSVLATFLLFYSSTFFLLSHGWSLFPPISGQGNEGNIVGFSQESRPGRSLVDEIADGPVEQEYENSPLPLALQRTKRKDPLDDFKTYTNGWNISNRHYWASVAYTAVPVFGVAAVWFLGFGICLLLIVVCYFCSKREPYGYSQTCYVLSLVLLILFSLAAMIGCAVLYIGQASFHHTTTTTLDYVVHQADSAVDKLRNVSDFLVQAKQVGIDRVFLPSNVQSDIDEIETRINASASTLADKTTENSDDIQDLLDSVRLALIIIAAVMLVLTFLGLLFSIFGMQLLVYILVISGWILVTGTFILCGLFLLLHKCLLRLFFFHQFLLPKLEVTVTVATAEKMTVTADTCVAMGEWIQYPTTHTALDDILPCVDKATAQETMQRSKEVTSELVNLVNQVITNVSNINFAPNFTPLYYNQSGPLMPLLCNPFRPDMTPRQCDPVEVELTNATQVYNNYVCQVSPNEICTTQGRLTPTFYNQISAGINVGYALYNYAPSLVELQDCTFVRETFTDISRDHCPGLQRYSRFVYVGLVMVSTAVMLSLIFWVIYGRERRHRLHTKELEPAPASAHIPDGDKDH